MKVFYTFSVKLSFCFKNFQLKEKISQIQIINLSNLNKNQWLHHYTCSGFCKTSYHLLIFPTPTNLPNTLNFILETKKLNACLVAFLLNNLSLIDLPTPYQPPKYVKIHTGGNKIDRQSRMWRQYTCYFPANGSTNPDVFQPKTFPIPRGIIPQNFSSLGFAVSEELGNKQTNTQTNSLTY